MVFARFGETTSMENGPPPLHGPFPFSTSGCVKRDAADSIPFRRDTFASSARYTHTHLRNTRWTRILVKAIGLKHRWRIIDESRFEVFFQLWKRISTNTEFEEDRTMIINDNLLRRGIHEIGKKIVRGNIRKIYFSRRFSTQQYLSFYHLLLLSLNCSS